MRVDIMTLFPDSMNCVLGESILGRAAAKGILEINCVQIRDYTENKQRQVDDYPYGGGFGCVMMAQPLKSCLDDIMSRAMNLRTRVIYMSPQGKRFDQSDARRLLDDYDHLVLVCGHYEGIDERFIEKCVDEELSVGDFVLTGGEIAAMAICDSVCRLVPGVLADEECFTDESHWNGLLEHPQYTRPEVWEDRAVPPELLTGNHASVSRWRRKKSLERTMLKRPDMFESFTAESAEDKKIIDEILEERGLAPIKYTFGQRRAQMSDMPMIMAIIGDAREFLGQCGIDQWQEEYPASQEFERDIREDGCWLFFCREQCVGVISVLQVSELCCAEIHDGAWMTETDNCGVIHRLAVRRDMRGTPLASEMFDFVEALYEGMGKQSLRIDTHGSNEPMLGLLKKRGFSYCGMIDVAVGAGHDPKRMAFEKVFDR